jgi:hypothetical protein
MGIGAVVFWRRDSSGSQVIEEPRRDYTEDGARLLLKDRYKQPAEFAEAVFLCERSAGPACGSTLFLSLQALHSSQSQALVESGTGAARVFVVRIARRLKF